MTAAIKRGILVLLLTATPSVAEDKMELLNAGYKIVYSSPFLSFDSCEWGKAYEIGPYIFVCREYEYAYAYGDADLLARSSNDAYLCLEDEEECIRGDLR